MKTPMPGMALMVVLALGAAGTDLNTGLVAYYPFTGSAVDESGNGNDGTVNGATLTPDRLGHTNSAYAFAGTPSSKITITSTNLLLQPPFSFCAWFNFANGSSNPRIVAVGGWEIATLGTGPSRRINFNDVTPVGVYDCSSPTAYPQGTWHHLVAVRSLDVMRLYIDSRLQNSVVVTQSVVYPGSFGTNWVPTIGGSSGIGYPYDSFGGSIDDVRIYNRDLSADEVFALFVQELGAHLELSDIPVVRLQFNTVAGRTYQIQASPDLVTWTNYDALIPGNGNVWGKDYLIQSSALFYRIGVAY